MSNAFQASEIRQRLIDQIAIAAEKRNLAPATICKAAIGNTRFYEKLLSGGDCNLTTAERVFEYLKRTTPQKQA